MFDEIYKLNVQTDSSFFSQADSKRWHDPKYYLAFESAKEIGIQGALPTKTSARGKTISTISEGKGSSVLHQLMFDL